MDESEIAFLAWWNTKQPLKEIMEVTQTKLTPSQLGAIHTWVKMAYKDAWKLRESETIMPRRGD